MSSNDADAWTSRLSRTLESYDEALLRRVASKLCKPRNQWPVEELLERCIGTFSNPAMLDRRLGELSEPARTLMVLLARSRQLHWRVGNLVEMLGALKCGDPLEVVQELLQSGILFPYLFSRSNSLPPVKTFEQWLAQSNAQGPAIFAHPAVMARAQMLEVALPSCPGQVNVAKAEAARPPQEADGLDWLLRLTVLWQQVSAGPLRRTQQGGFFKRDLDRLRGDPLLIGAAPDSICDVPDPGLLAVSLALGVGLLEERGGELHVARFPASWEQGLPAALAELWSAFLTVGDWNPNEGWTVTAPSAQPYPAVFLLALTLLGQLPEAIWAKPDALEAWIVQHHPYWAGRSQREAKESIGVVTFLLGFAYQLRLLQAKQNEAGDWVVRLSALGQWLLNQGPEPAFPTFPQTLLVQPNLEILVYRQGLSPALLGRLGRFAAWKGFGAALTMQLQPESVYAGLEAGESFETISQTLDRHGMKPTPDTVINTLRTWANKRDRIQVYAGGALFEFYTEADLNEALARGLPAIRLNDRLAIVAAEKDIDYRHFRLAATRDYGLPPEKCVDVEADGVTLSIDLTRSDLMIETEVQRFAEPLERKEAGRRFFTLTPNSAAAARESGLSLAGMETWFLQRCGQPITPAARLLFTGPDASPARLQKRLVLEVPSADLADGLQQWPATRALIEARLGPTFLVVPEESVAALCERLSLLGMNLKQDHSATSNASGERPEA